MIDNELDFTSIQKIFAEKDASKKKKYEFEEKVNSRETRHQTIPLKSEKRYDAMRPKNIRITPKAHQLAKRNKLVLAVGVALILTTSAISFGATSLNQTSNDSQSIVYIDDDYDQDEKQTIVLEECDFTNMAVIVNRSTFNVASVVNTTEKELKKFGVNTTVTRGNDEVLATISQIKEETPEKQIVVINVDGEVNQTSSSVVLMTNYIDNMATADAITLGIKNANADIYGPSSTVVSGKKSSSGSRMPTSLEEALFDAGYSDVVNMTVAIRNSYIDDNIVNSNNIATSIAESIARYATLSKEEQETDYIVRVSASDTVSNLAISNGVSESYITTINNLSHPSSVQYGQALIVKKVPTNLTGKVIVDNPFVTTDPNEVSDTVGTYTVEAGDTVSEIADKLGIPANSFVIPGGDVNKIQVGDVIRFPSQDGILISTILSRQK